MIKKLTVCLLFLFCNIAIASSPVLDNFDKKDFLKDPLITEEFWSDRDHELYGKSVAEWDGQDFEALEKKLKEQLAHETERYLDSIEKKGFITFQDKTDYELVKTNLEASINTIPEMKIWVELANEQSGKKLVKHLADEKDDAVDMQDKALSMRGTDLGKYINGNQTTSEKADERARMKSYVTRYANKAKLKSTILWSMLGIFTLLTVSIGGWIWFRYFRIREPSCPKCKVKGRDMIKVSAPIKKSFSDTGFGVSRKYYCNNCEYKWIQRNE